jgi:formylmethanofuran dehydrogenase subunit D
MTMLTLTLITGRTKEQARGMHVGKDSDEYRQATAVAELNPADLDRLGMEEGRELMVHSAFGQARVTALKSNIPEGLVFIPMGPSANLLVGNETFGTGMPSFKGLAVQLEKI